MGSGSTGKRFSWKTRYGFYLAAIGSACGLGNLWRFPYIVGENGGGAFVLIYVLFALLLGLPILIGELMIGRLTRKGILTGIQQLTFRLNPNFRWIGIFSLLMSLVVLSYYAVISGWVLHFFTVFLITLFRSSPAFTAHLTVQTGMSALLSNGILQLGLASAHLLLTLVVVLKGVQEGFEKWIGYIMPLFALLLAALIIESLSLPTSLDALRFLFYPDFSKLSVSSFLYAIGHVFFTLSVGFGTMVTFGSYLHDTDHVPTVAFRVAIVDTVLSLLAGLLVFPIALEASNAPLTDPDLLFEVLPRFLIKISGGPFFGLAFFLCLYLAALSASIGLLEVIVTNWTEKIKISRIQAAWSAVALTLLLAVFPALSSTVLKNIKFFGNSFLENLDFVLINIMLPLIALSMCFLIQKVPSKDKKDLFVDTSRIESVALYSHWLFAINYLIPISIVLIMSVNLIKKILS